MDLRVLRYFLAVASEGSITRAAEVLYVTQPTVSKQILELEDELGTSLFTRRRNSMVLTDDGLLLQKKALEIIHMVDAVEADLRHEKKSVSGDIFIGGAESSSLEYVSAAIERVQDSYPAIRFHLLYGDAYTSMDRLDHGLIDFAILNDQTNDKNHSISLPARESWGLVTSPTQPLYSLQRIRPMDLRKTKLMLTRQTSESNSFEGWLGYSKSRLQVIGTFDIANLALPLVEKGLCSCIMMDRSWLYRSDALKFIPLDPPLRFSGSLYWSRSRPLSEPCRIFLDTLKEVVSAYQEG